MEKGLNCIIGKEVSLGQNVKIGHNVIIEDNVIIKDNVMIDNNTIIRTGTILGKDTIIGMNCIIGEHPMSWYEKEGSNKHALLIGEKAFIRSGTIIYSNSKIGDYLQTGHFASIREKTEVGNHVSIGTLCNIQGYCKIGNYVRMHSNVQIGQKSIVDDYVWIFPNVVLTNDPNPPSDELLGSHICSFAIIATGAIILPGRTIHEDSLVAAGAVVGEDVEKYSVVRGNPAKKVLDVRYIRNLKDGKKMYPWKYRFGRAMPWEGQEYEKWRKSLDITTLKK